LAIAFHVACSAPAPTTMTAMGTVIWECGTAGSFCLSLSQACE
jgi:hypothetical protein